ncbi:hypothetical protein PSTG_09676 [Puccinia striiformis f. sp. tritici PST-78]|uniref:Uncharacterized protein n=1 Tax=Puccinia striiformis f. sp. tritici PST-78 TaxID=1165861 RepID=A0A0L0VCS9_9BASI|nr:hypothetical protein PSTG_09676 [Puccinia striiformis f. sp. tritici PST-78]
MNLLFSLVLPFLVFQVIKGLDLIPRNLNKFESRATHPSKEALGWNKGVGGHKGKHAPSKPEPPCC